MKHVLNNTKYFYKYVALSNSSLTHPLVHISGDAKISPLIMQYYTRMYRHDIQLNIVQTLLHPQGFLQCIDYPATLRMAAAQN